MIYIVTQILCGSWLLIFLFFSINKSVVAQPSLPNPDNIISPKKPQIRDAVPDFSSPPEDSSPVKQKDNTPSPSEDYDIPSDAFLVREIKIVSNAQTDETIDLKLGKEIRQCIDLFLVDQEFWKLENYNLKNESNTAELAKKSIPDKENDQEDPVPQPSILNREFMGCKPRKRPENFAGREVTLQELLDLRTILSKLYIYNGYATSAAFIPTNQDVSDGIVKIQVIEGSVEKINILGLKRLKEYYIRDRIERSIDKPLKITDLEAALQLLQGGSITRKCCCRTIWGQ